MRTASNHEQKSARHSRRLVWFKRLSRVLLALAILFWIAGGLLYCTERSVFTTSAVRLGPPLYGRHPPPLPGMTTIEYRDEVHYMAGQGGLFIGGNTVRSASFAANPSADAISKSLAWSNVEMDIPTWYIWRYYWNSPYGFIGIRFLPLAVLTTLAWGACVVLRRRQVPPGHCVHCRYDLRGTSSTPPTTNICPECGASTL